METVGVPSDSYVLKTKAYKFVLKVDSFSFLPFTVLAQQREKHGCGWIPPPPGLNRVKDAKVFKRGTKIRNCQCEILYKICKVQLVNKFKDSSNSVISIAIQLSNSFWE